MKYLITIIMCLPLISEAQNSPVTEFGEIKSDVLQQTVFPIDSSASAIILFDIGSFKAGVFTRHTRIKILKEDGYGYANVDIPVFRRSSAGTNPVLKRIKASTFNWVDGRIVETKLENKGTFVEQVVSGLNVIRLALPNVKVGSVLEYEFEIRGGFRDWEFQHRIPCIWSEYRVSIADAVEFTVRFNGYLAPLVNESKFEACLDGQCQVRRWVMANVPAFKDEPYISYYKNYTSQVIFQVNSVRRNNGPAILGISDWITVARRYEEYLFVNREVQQLGFLKPITKEMVENLQSPDEKLKTIFEFVRNKFEWNGIDREVPSWLTISSNNRLGESPKTIFERSKGSSGDINLILLAMLRYAGLPADPVLISTSENGLVRQEVPSMEQFNRVVVSSDYKAKKILLDATDKYLPMDYLPRPCLNGQGYVALDNKYQWVTLTDMPKSRNLISMDLEITEEGDVKGKGTFSKTGYYAGEAREQIAKKGKSTYLNKLLEGRQVKLADSVMEGQAKPGEMLKETYSVVLAEYGQKTGDVIYIDPIVFNRETSNPFIAPTRSYPINFEYPREKVYTLKLKIPEGYGVDDLPKPKLSVLPDNAGKFVFSVTESNGIINIMSQININRAIFSQDEYTSLREFFNIITAKHSESIVLKKR